MNKKHNCENCISFRPIRFNHRAKDEVVASNEITDIFPNTILNFENNGIKSSGCSESSNKTLGVCVKKIELIDDSSRIEECCKLKKHDAETPFQFYLRKTIDAGSSRGVIEKSVHVEQYKQIKSSERYCGNCKRWCEIDYDDKKLLSVYIPYDIESSNSLLCPDIMGYCLYDNSTKKSDCSGCEHHIGLYEYKDATTTDNFIPMISPRYRYINSIRMVRSLLWLELFYRCKINEEILGKTKNMDNDASKKAKKVSNKVNPRAAEVLSPKFISRITGCDIDTIRRHLTDEKIANSHSYYLMGALADYFNIPLKIIYGIKHSDYILDTTYHNELIVTLESEYKYGDKNTIYKNSSYLWVDELFLYGISILLKIYSKEELEKFIESYEEHASSLRKRDSKTEHDKNSIKSRVVSANKLNSIRDFSFATEIKERQIKNYYTNKSGEYEEGKGKLTHTDLLRICNALGISMNEIITGDKPDKLNPFEHFTDEQIKYQEYTEDRYYMDYLLNNIRYLYSLNSDGKRNQKVTTFNNDLVRTIINLYRTCGIKASFDVLERELSNLSRKKPQLFKILVDKKAFSETDYSY